MCFTADDICVVGWSGSTRVFLWDMSSIPTSFTELPVTHVAHACIEQSCSLVWVIQFNSSGLLSFTVTFQ
jgi:hypothetical protein